jgi:NADH-ubiquinone oxidoreductase chain 4
MTYFGWRGAIIIIVAHGLCSSGLFALVGLIYNRLSRRSILLVRGSLATIPLIALWWFLFRIFNIAAPPSSNLAGEVFIFITIINWLNYSTLIVGILSFIGAAYRLYLFSATQHGAISSLRFYACDSECREHLVLIGHFLFLLLSLFILIGLLGCYNSL